MFQAETWWLENYKEVKTDGPLFSRSLGIRFQLENKHFVNNVLILQCKAQIADLPPWGRSLKIFSDNPLLDGIHAQNRLNNSGE